jgi:hypothetical protein
LQRRRRGLKSQSPAVILLASLRHIVASDSNLTAGIFFALAFLLHVVWWPARVRQLLIPVCPLGDVGGPFWLTRSSATKGRLPLGGNFLVDPAGNKRFSITTSELETATITGVSGNTSSLIRFGTDDLAFRTSNNQVIIAHSGIVAPTLRGDLNRDGQLTAADISSMIGALLSLNASKTAHGMSDVQLRAVGDVNGDFNPAAQTGGVNNADRQALLNLLKAGSMTSVPEPSSLVLSVIAMATLIKLYGDRYRRSLSTKGGA